MTMSHQKSKKVEEGESILIIKDTLISFLLLASLVFVLGACSDSETSSVKSSTCFEFNEDKTQITGYLETAENGGACPKDVVIPDGVTSIADSVFENKGLTSVSFPDGLTNIGMNAFKDNNLKSLDVPDSVTDIEDQAFVGNSFSSYVYISNENANVDNSAFDSTVSVAQEGMVSCFVRATDDNTVLTDYPCSDLIIEIPNDVTSIVDRVFENKGLTSVSFPNGLTSIGMNAFKDNNLESLDIPDSVTDIGESAFVGNSFSSYVYISNENANVDNSAFDSTVSVAQEGTESCFVRATDDNTVLADYPCSDLIIEIPNDVTNIADRVFENKGLTSVSFPNGLTSIGMNAFKDNNLDSLDIPDSVTDIEDSAFAGNSFSSYVYISNENANVNNSAFDSSIVVVVEGTDSCFARDANDDTILTDYFCLATRLEVPNDVTSIADSVFENKGLISVSFPDGLTSIGMNAFKDNNLDSLDIPDSVTSIGSYAFSKNSLTSVEIPDSVTDIGSFAFSYNSLTSVEIPDSVISIGSYAFSYNSLTSVEIPDSVTSIKEFAFSKNSLTSVEIPDSVISIGSYAFSYNSLTSVEIPDSVTSIGDSAFSENSLTSVEIPDSVISIKAYAFSSNSLTSVVIPDKV